MTIVIIFMLLFFNAPLSYGQEAVASKDSGQVEEFSAPFYAPLYDRPQEVRESYAYYNPHAGQIVEVSVNQKDGAHKVAGFGSSGAVRHTRTFYNRHAGQRIEVPLDTNPEDSLEKSSASSLRREIYRYNPYSRQWEKTTPGTQLTFNPRADTWSYEEEGAHPRYNPYSEQWEQATGDESLRYNSQEDRWSYRQ